jgi:uncharacterized protein
MQEIPLSGVVMRVTGLSVEFEKQHQLAVRLHNRAAKYHSQGQAVRPEKLYRQALELQESLLGGENPEVALTLNNLALYYKAIGRLAEARRLYERALAIFQKTQGASHENTASTMFNLAMLLRAQSQEMEERARRAEKEAREMADPVRIAKAIIRQELSRYRLRTGASRINRFGVFAMESIPDGQKIIPYTGKHFSRAKWRGRGSRTRTYLLRLNKYWIIDGSVGGSGAELINHSCDPNCRFSINGNEAWIVSIRSIAPEEELMLDYRFSSRPPVVPCYCGAPNCRGMMNRPRQN